MNTNGERTRETLCHQCRINSVRGRKVENRTTSTSLT